MAYLEKKDHEHWLEALHELLTERGDDGQLKHLFVANTHFLAHQIYHQTGALIHAVRPFASYARATWVRLAWDTNLSIEDGSG